MKFNVGNEKFPLGLKKSVKGGPYFLWNRKSKTRIDSRKCGFDLDKASESNRVYSRWFQSRFNYSLIRATWIPNWETDPSGGFYFRVIFIIRWRCLWNGNYVSQFLFKCSHKIENAIRKGPVCFMLYRFQYGWRWLFRNVSRVHPTLGFSSIRFVWTAVTGDYRNEQKLLKM